MWESCFYGLKIARFNCSSPTATVNSSVHRFVCHTSEIRGLRSMKCSCETLQNLLYFMYKKTHVVFFLFHFVQLYFFPYECPGLTLQNLLYFMYKKTHVVFFVFHFVQLYFFPYECSGLCRHIQGEKGKIKVARNEKGKKLHGFSYT